MKTEFTLRELMNKRPCWKEFAKLMRYIEIDIDRKVVQTFISVGGSMCVSAVDMQGRVFSSEELDTVISADAVANAARDEKVANRNLTWCWVADLLSEKMKITTTTVFVAVYEEPDHQFTEAESTASNDFEETFARTFAMAKSWRDKSFGGRLLFSEDKREITLLENWNPVGRFTITEKRIITTVCEATQEEEEK